MILKWQQVWKWAWICLLVLWVSPAMDWPPDQGLPASHPFDSRIGSSTAATLNPELDISLRKWMDVFAIQFWSIWLRNFSCHREKCQTCCFAIQEISFSSYSAVFWHSTFYKKKSAQISFFFFSFFELVKKDWIETRLTHYYCIYFS